jgi:type II secretory pathway component PulF
MALYNYKAYDKNQTKVTGLVDAVNESSAAEILKEKGYEVLSIETKTGFSFASLIPFFNRIKAKDIVAFSRQFAVLVTANITIVQSLKILVTQTVSDKLRTTLADIAQEVDGGAKLSDSLEKRPKVFSNFFVNVVRSGESSGKLDEVLNYLADEMEKDYDMMSKIRGAMIYPAFIMSGLIGVGVIMMVSVVPKLTAVLEETGAELPLPTKILIGTSRIMQSYWWLLIIAIGGLVFLFRAITNTPGGSMAFDHFKLKMPIFGRLLNRIYLVRFTRSLNTLLVGGVAISKALKITSDVVNNAVFQDMITKTIKEVEDGNSISTVFSTSKQVPKMVSQMMTIGEETGRLDVVLANVTNFYGREITNMTNNLMTLMEPLIMLVMGVAVGIMVAAIILPMYNMASNM